MASPLVADKWTNPTNILAPTYLWLTLRYTQEANLLSHQSYDWNEKNSFNYSFNMTFVKTTHTELSSNYHRYAHRPNATSCISIITRSNLSAKILPKFGTTHRQKNKSCKKWKNMFRVKRSNLQMPCGLIKETPWESIHFVEKRWITFNPVVHFQNTSFWKKHVPKHVKH